MRKILLHRDRPARPSVSSLVFTLLVLVASMSSTALAADKMKAADVVAKHLESIGTAAARSSAKSRLIAGNARATYKARNSTGSIDGNVAIGSVNRNTLLAILFEAPNYPGEKFGFDGKKLTVGYITPGIRSALGNFVLQYGEVFREGLMGGTLSTAWALLNVEERGAKLEYAGTEKIDDRETHKLNYTPKKGSEVRITLYFDATTFEHVRTQYNRVIATRLSAGGIDNQARQMETRYKIVENFSGYKKEGELNLPHNYKVQIEIFKTTGSSMEKWEMDLSQFLFDQPIEDAKFNVEGI